jgi:hypothetical protein
MFKRSQNRTPEEMPCTIMLAARIAFLAFRLGVNGLPSRNLLIRSMQ